jgi:16S rRNA (cytosine1402-N4)-methyltransferase
MSEHVSVLLPESIDLLDVRDGLTYLDLTLGRGGSSAEILKRNPHGQLIAFDIDEEAVAESKKRLERIGTNFKLVRENYSAVASVLSSLGIAGVDGVIMDLGVSSPQFDEAYRGFSYREEAPLDMRMDQRNPLTAERIVNTYSYEDLKRIFKEYGEDPDSARVAKAIVETRLSHPIETTGELVEIIKANKPASSLRKKGHPAKQIFQALRIETNDELGHLQTALEALPDLMNPGGVIAIISFQSLEDRLVKDKFRSLTVVEGSRHEPTLLPSQEKQAPFLALTHKPVVPSDEEILANHRAASAKLRAIRKKGE